MSINKNSRENNSGTTPQKNGKVKKLTFSKESKQSPTKFNKQPNIVQEKYTRKILMD